MQRIEITEPLSMGSGRTDFGYLARSTSGRVSLFIGTEVGDTWDDLESAAAKWLLKVDLPEQPSCTERADTA